MLSTKVLSVCLPAYTWPSAAEGLQLSGSGRLRCKWCQDICAQPCSVYDQLWDLCKICLVRVDISYRIIKHEGTGLRCPSMKPARVSLLNVAARNEGQRLPPRRHCGWSI